MKWAKREPMNSPETAPNPIQVPILKGGKLCLHTYIDWDIQIRITTMNQTKRNNCGTMAKNIATFAPTTKSILPPAGFGEKYSNGLSNTKHRKGTARTQSHGLGTQSKRYGMHAAENPTRLGATTGQRGGSSHFMERRPNDPP
jgi:hypothetical protein